MRTYRYLLATSRIYLSTKQSSLATYILAFSYSFIANSFILLSYNYSFIAIAKHSLAFYSNFRTTAYRSSFARANIITNHSYAKTTLFITSPLLYHSLSAVKHYKFYFSSYNYFSASFLSAVPHFRMSYSSYTLLYRLYAIYRRSI